MHVSDVSGEGGVANLAMEWPFQIDMFYFETGLKICTLTLKNGAWCHSIRTASPQMCAYACAVFDIEASTVTIRKCHQVVCSQGSFHCMACDPLCVSFAV